MLDQGNNPPHVATRGHIIPTPRLLLSPTPYKCLSEKQEIPIVLVVGAIRPGIEPTGGMHANYHTTKAV